MYQCTEMDEVVRCDTSNIVEKSITSEIPKNYHSIITSFDHLEKNQTELIGGSDKKKLLLKHYCCFQEQVSLQWRDIVLKTKGGINILKGLHGSASSGELTALMGPSGAGKTALLNVLSGFSQKRVTGEILVNGRKREMQSFRRLSSYVLQDDCVLTRFTVRELVTLACRLKMPHAVSEEDRQKAVDNCIFSLGLVLQQNKRANTLSSSERKRLYITQEIVNNPPLIFLDEPTSGLDSASSLQCIQLLKSWAEEGRNIICAIHKPSSEICEMFDKLYVVSCGECIYRGSTGDLQPFLESQGFNCPKYRNPTDFIIHVASGVYGDRNWKLIKATASLNGTEGSLGYVEDDLPKQEETNYVTSMFRLFQNKVKETKKENSLDMRYKKYATSYFNQFHVLVKRSFCNSLKDPVNMTMKFIVYILAGIFCGTLFYNTGNDAGFLVNTTGLLFTTLFFIIIIAQVSTIISFSEEKTVIEREYFNGWYSLKMYHLAITVAEIPFQVIFPAINYTLIYWLSGQPMDMSRLCLFLLSAVLVSFTSESIGLMIGAGTSVRNGIYLSITTSSAAMLLTGGLLKLSKTPVCYRWLHHCSYTRYALQSMHLSLYENRPRLECSPGNLCLFRDSMKFLKFMDMEGDIFIVYLALTMFFFFFRIASYLVFHFRFSR